MKRITYWVLSTVSALVLLFSYGPSTSSSMTASTSVHAPAAVAVNDSQPSAASGTTSPTDATSGTSATDANTVTGSVACTRWGPVQVQLTVSSGKITDVQVVQYPDGNGRDREINSYALPVLVQETLSSQNAQIDMVSGATVTSEGYLQSLQSALDQAQL